MKCTTILTAFTCAIAFATTLLAHEEMIAPAVRVEKVFTAGKVLGRVRVTYDAGDGTVKKPSLVVECGDSKVTLPPAALEDLPGPDWDGSALAYADTSYDTAAHQWVDRPYFYLMVKLHGPPGEAKTWERTWVNYHFDEKGRFEKRSLKRFVDLPESHSTAVVWKDWPVGKGIGAAELLEQGAGK